jgi:hypothetical protein
VTADAAGTSIEHHWLAERDDLADEELGQRITEVPCAPSRAAASDQIDYVHTLASSASPSELELPILGVPARSRTRVLGLGVALLLVSAILTSFSLTAGHRSALPEMVAEARAAGDGANRIPPAPQTPIAAPSVVSPPARLAAPVPTERAVATAVVDAGPRETARGRLPRPPGRATPNAPGGRAGKRPMPLPSSPDF